jgi:hypothetical protein
VPILPSGVSKGESDVVPRGGLGDAVMGAGDDDRVSVCGEFLQRRMVLGAGLHIEGQGMFWPHDDAGAGLYVGGLSDKTIDECFLGLDSGDGDGCDPRVGMGQIDQPSKQQQSAQEIGPSQPDLNHQHGYESRAVNAHRGQEIPSSRGAGDVPHGHPGEVQPEVLRAHELEECPHARNCQGSDPWLPLSALDQTVAPSK